MTETHPEQQTPPPKKAKTAQHDLILLTKDGQRIPARRRTLQAHSEVLADLIDASDKDELELDEDASVVEVLLSYCSSERIPPLDVGREDLWKVTAAFSKYKIGRGLDAVATAWQQVTLTACFSLRSKLINSLRRRLKVQVAETSPFKDLLGYYLFAVGYSEEEVPVALAKVIAAGVDTNTPFAQKLLEEIAEASGISDNGKLVKLLETRARYLIMARTTALSAELVNNLKSQGTQTATFATFASMLELWNESRACTTERALVEYLKARDLTVKKGAIPWVALRDVLRQLPAKLD